MRLCSEPIKRPTLELGGKSPAIVFADANLDDAIPSSVWSIYYAAGQRCEARSCVLVEASIYDDFVARFAEATRQLKVGDPLDAETQVGSLISTVHRDRVNGYVEKGRGEGAEVVVGGEAGDGGGAFYQPTLLAGVETSMAVAQEEIFGPVAVAIPFEDEKDAIRIANDVQYGLFATVWTGDPARGHRVARAVSRGWSESICRSPPSRASVRRLQAVGLRPRAFDRHARPLSRDEGRPLLDGREALQPLRSLATS